MSDSSDDRRAKEILSSLSQRETVGDRICVPWVGGCGVANGATSPRLFALYDIRIRTSPKVLIQNEHCLAPCRCALVKTDDSPHQFESPRPKTQEPFDTPPSSSPKACLKIPPNSK